MHLVFIRTFVSDFHYMIIVAKRIHNKDIVEIGDVALESSWQKSRKRCYLRYYHTVCAELTQYQKSWLLIIDKYCEYIVTPLVLIINICMLILVYCSVFKLIDQLCRIHWIYIAYHFNIKVVFSSIKEFLPFSWMQKIFTPLTMAMNLPDIITNLFYTYCFTCTWHQLC